MGPGWDEGGMEAVWGHHGDTGGVGMGVVWGRDECGVTAGDSGGSDGGGEGVGGYGVSMGMGVSVVWGRPYMGCPYMGCPLWGGPYGVSLMG